MLYEQHKLILLQQQQQKLAMQQLQLPSQPQVQQGPPQMQMKQQQLMQPPLQVFYLNPKLLPIRCFYEFFLRQWRVGFGPFNF